MNASGVREVSKTLFGHLWERAGGRQWGFSTTYTILGGWKNMFLLFSANTGSVALGPKYLNIWDVRSAGRASQFIQGVRFLNYCPAYNMTGELALAEKHSFHLCVGELFTTEGQNQYPFLSPQIVRTRNILLLKVLVMSSSSATQEIGNNRGDGRSG